MGNIVVDMITEKCPFCSKGKVFKENTSLLKVPEMNENCSTCGRDLIGEPGYFFGSMYVSYAIAVGFGIVTFLICKFVLHIQSLELIIGIIVSVVILISYKNYKWSKIFWLKIFPPGAGTNFLGGGNKRTFS